MDLSFRHLLNGNFHNDSRVWIYQCNRLFGLGEALEIEEMLRKFIETWNSHGTPVKGEAHLLFGQFIVLIADETATGVSGCSTDSSVRLIKQIEQQFRVNMFDRTTLAFIVKDKVQLLPMTQLQYAADNGFISPDTLYFNNLVQTKSEMELNWIAPVSQGWLAKKITFQKTVS